MIRSLTIEDLVSTDEQRFVAIGINVLGKLRVVVYAMPSEDVRIISVRKPEPKEVRDYEKGV
jgi:uncharacterized DUF497 family protein